MIARFGEKINNPDSIAYWAWKNKIPIYCPPLTDGSIGDMLFFHSYKNPGLRCAPAPCAGSVGGWILLQSTGRQKWHKSPPLEQMGFTDVCKVLCVPSAYSLLCCQDCTRNGVAITGRWEGGTCRLEAPWPCSPLPLPALHPHHVSCFDAGCHTEWIWWRTSGQSTPSP